MAPDDQLLLAVLALVIVANVLVLATLRPARGRRRSTQHEVRAASVPADVGDARTVADIEAFVAEVAADAAGGIRPPSAAEVMARRREVINGAVNESTAGPPASDSPRLAAARAPVPPHPSSAPSSASVADLAGLVDGATWDRAVREESARAARFGRPITVVMAELPDLDDLADHLGRDVADRVVVETARLLASAGRAVDRIAWLGEARFGVLLLETEEARAPGYVDRVRATADDWLQSAGLTIRLSLGWASPADGSDVLGAATLARQRMHEAGRTSRAGRRDAHGVTGLVRR